MPAHQRVTRRIRPTALVYCEGAHDLAFVRHIRKLYSSKSATMTKFKDRQGGGGAATSLMNELKRTPGDFDRYLLKVDDDRNQNEHQEAVRMAEGMGNTEICWSNPSLDALLLSILNPGTDYSRRQSNTCKSEFERNYIPHDKRTNPTAYDTLFTIEVIEEARQRIPELNQLVNFFEA